MTGSTLRLLRENQRRRPGSFDETGIDKPDAGQPSGDLFKRVRIAVLGVHQHVDGKKEPHDGSAAIRVYQKLGNRDGAA